MCRAIDLSLEPAESRAAQLKIETYTYDPAAVSFAEMSETVKLSIHLSAGNIRAELTPDEARVLANQLLQVADVCDEHRTAREERELAEAEEHRQRDLEWSLMQQAEERGEEYVPASIGCGHLDAIEHALEHGMPLRWWQADLVQGDPRLARCEVIPRRGQEGGAA